MRKWWRRTGKPHPKTHEPDVPSLITGISTLYEARPRLLAELRRARRHERPLTLLSLAPEGVWRAEKGSGDRPANGHGALSRNGGGTDSSSNGAFLHFDLVFVGVLLRNTLRETDLVALSLDDPAYAVLLPETCETDGHVTAARLDRVIRDRTSLTVRVGAAAFPQDGFTIEDLLCRARYAWRHRPIAPTASTPTPSARSAPS